MAPRRCPLQEKHSQDFHALANLIISGNDLSLTPTLKTPSIPQLKPYLPPFRGAQAITSSALTTLHTPHHVGNYPLGLSQMETSFQLPTWTGYAYNIGRNFLMRQSRRLTQNNRAALNVIFSKNAAA